MDPLSTRGGRRAESRISCSLTNKNVVAKEGKSTDEHKMLYFECISLIVLS